jgi:hypothetical protein
LTSNPHTGLDLQIGDHVLSLFLSSSDMHYYSGTYSLPEDKLNKYKIQKTEDHYLWHYIYVAYSHTEN